MSKKPLTLYEALAWFELDKATVDEEKIKTAFRVLAKKYHPDTRGNYKEKLAASENFVAATEAKDMLIEACRRRALPIIDQTIQAESDIPQPQSSTNKFKDFDLHDYQRKKPKEEKEPATKSFADRLTGRHKYDFHNPRPMERLMDIRYIGGAVGFVLCIGAMIAMISGSLTLMPFIMIYPLVKKYINADKMADLLSGIPMFIIYYAATYIGILILADGRETVAIGMVALAWGCITMFAIDEIYSLIRYRFVLKKIRQDLTLVGEDQLPI